MRYTVPAEFNLPTFLAACLAAGVSLEKTDSVPSPDGDVTRSGDSLEVHLGAADAAKDALVTTAVEAQGGSAA